MSLRDLFRNTKMVYPVKKLRTVRAMYESQDIQRVQMQLELETGDSITVEFTPRQAYQVVVQTKAAYEAIHPSIPNTRPDSPSW